MNRGERLESLLARWVERKLAGCEPLDPAALCRDDSDLAQPLRDLVVECESVARRRTLRGFDRLTQVADSAEKGRAG